MRQPVENLDSSITFAHIIYLLQALGFFSGVTAIIAVIISYIKLDDVRGTWLETHYRWQIKTFWYWIILSIIGAVLIFVLVGYILLVIVWIWAIYRIIKGWIRLSERRPIMSE
ncbi:MAG: hypothetical protein A3E87_03105 [Gammaproteobacteria bacterium RIFCSPHIGHO2_12_FULL_35_23]|nr:MAG: hypothetical protein A3E87_03105 [Gammaproteobacteria bacterium RIFCSPHIGHO2_12_FULL_35_23]